MVSSIRQNELSFLQKRSRGSWGSGVGSGPRDGRGRQRPSPGRGQIRAELEMGLILQGCVRENIVPEHSLWGQSPWAIAEGMRSLGGSSHQLCFWRSMGGALKPLFLLSDFPVGENISLTAFGR